MVFFSFFKARRVQSADSLPSVKSRHNTTGRLMTPSSSQQNTVQLTSEEKRVIHNAKSQFHRRGGFIRIFPAAESWKRYSAYLGILNYLLENCHLILVFEIISINSTN